MTPAKKPDQKQVDEGPENDLQELVAKNERDQQAAAAAIKARDEAQDEEVVRSALLSEGGEDAAGVKAVPQEREAVQPEPIEPIEETPKLTPRQIQREYRELYSEHSDRLHDSATAIQRIAELANETGLQPAKKMTAQMYENLLDLLYANISEPASQSRVIATLDNMARSAGLRSLQYAAENFTHKPPQKLFDTFYKKMAQIGQGRRMDLIAEMTGFAIPDLPEADKAKLQHWVHTENGVEMICEWDSGYEGYVLYLPQAESDQLASGDNLFLISKNPDDAAKVFAATTELAKALDPQQTDIDNATVLYQQAYNKTITEIIPGSKKSWSAILKRQQMEKGTRVFDTFERVVMQRGGHDIAEAISDLNKRLEVSDISEAEKLRGETFLEYLQTLQEIQSDKFAALQGVIQPQTIRSIEAIYNKMLTAARKKLEKTFPQAALDTDTWVSGMFTEGLLRAEPVLRSDFGVRIWDYRVQPNLDPELLAERKALMQAKTEAEVAGGELDVAKQQRLAIIDAQLTPTREAIHNKALEKALQKRNERLFGISDEERNLSDTDWQQFVGQKRAEIVQTMKADIQRRAELSVKSNGGKNFFTDYFRGLFVGENELVADRTEVGQTMPNSEFIAILFGDREYVMSLLFVVDSDQFLGRLGDRNFPGRYAFRNLIEVYRTYYPDAADQVCGNLVDSLLRERGTYHQDQERSQSLSLEGRSLTYDERREADPQTIETDYFFNVTYTLDNLGIHFPYDALESVQQTAGTEGVARHMDRLNPVSIFERTYGTLENPVRNMYTEVCRRLWGDERFVEKIRDTALFPSIHVENEEERRLYQNRDIEGSKEDHVVRDVLKHLRDLGLLDFSSFHELVKAAEGKVGGLEDDSYRQSQARQEIKGVTAVGRASVFVEQTEQAIDIGLALNALAAETGQSVEALLEQLRK